MSFRLFHCLRTGIKTRTVNPNRTYVWAVTAISSPCIPRVVSRRNAHLRGYLLPIHRSLQHAAPKDQATARTAPSTPPASTPDAVTRAEQRRIDWKIIRRLMHHVWPRYDWNTRGRVLLGFGLLVVGKVLPSYLPEPMLFPHAFSERYSTSRFP